MTKIIDTHIRNINKTVITVFMSIGYIVYYHHSHN